MPERSVNSRKRSEPALNDTVFALVLSSQNTANIFAPTEYTSSAPHLISRVAPGRPPQNFRSASRFMGAAGTGRSASRRLREPALAAAVVLFVPEAPSFGGR